MYMTLNDPVYEMYYNNKVGNLAVRVHKMFLLKSVRVDMGILWTFLHSPKAHICLLSLYTETV